MKFFIIFILLFLHMQGEGQTAANEFGIHDSSDAVITNWMATTEVFFPADSASLGEGKPLYIDSSGTWEKIALNNLLRFAGKANDEYVFVIRKAIMDSCHGNLQYALEKLGKGFIYGHSAIEQLYLKLNLTATRKYKQEMIFLTDFLSMEQNVVFFWNAGLIAELSLPAPPGTKGASILRTFSISDYVNSGLFLSNSLRDYIEVPNSLLKLSVEQYDDLASNFLSSYFKPKYGLQSALASKAPPTIILDKVKGYITGADGYWEIVQVKLDNIQPSNNRLLIQCTLDGAYIKIKTPSIEPSAFERPYVLEKDYQHQINASGLAIIAHFKTFILNQLKK